MIASLARTSLCLSVLLPLMVTASPASAESKGQMCARRQQSCVTKCSGTYDCRQVCTTIWEDCIDHGGWSKKAALARAPSPSHGPQRGPVQVDHPVTINAMAHHGGGRH